MEQYENPTHIIQKQNLKSGSVSWESPSNIAIVKYWGKYGDQLPKNPSLSMTLKNAVTRTKLNYSVKEDGNEISLDFLFEGVKNQAFAKKISQKLKRLLPIFPFLDKLHLKIESTNTFPHSSGIASSASAMSALALCLCTVEEQLLDQKSEEKDFFKKASYVARLGSGSASRSVFPNWSVWGESPLLQESSNLYGIHLNRNIHSVFSQLRDDILIVSKDVKSVSSTAGHQLMESNPYADVRYNQAHLHMKELLEALEKGNVEKFGEILEKEALILHALMMASTPSYILMKPNTLAIIEAVRRYRKEKNLPIYFSLDAGPNIHLFYLEENSKDISVFIESELRPLCQDETILQDGIGAGPIKGIL